MSKNVYDVFIALALEARNMYFFFQKKENSFMYKTYIFKNCLINGTRVVNNESAHKASVL